MVNGPSLWTLCLVPGEIGQPTPLPNFHNPPRKKALRAYIRPYPTFVSDWGYVHKDTEKTWC